MVLEVDEAVQLLGNLDPHILQNASAELSTAYQYFGNLWGNAISDWDIDRSTINLNDSTVDGDTTVSTSVTGVSNTSPEQYISQLVRLREWIESTTGNVNSNMEKLVNGD